jgi:uncharacterized membrane protein YeaQ/YmgE (transglycosylase-associated protein family)
MLVSVGQLIVWMLIGLLAGSLAGQLLSGHSPQAGTSLALGLLGGVLGGLAFNALNIRIGGEITFSLHDLVAALVGAFVLLALLRLLRR